MQIQLHLAPRHTRHLQRSILKAIALGVAVATASAIPSNTATAQQQFPLTLPGYPSASNGPSGYFANCLTAMCANSGGGTATNSGVINGNTTSNPTMNPGPLRAPGVNAYGFTSWAYFPCVTLACTPDGATLSQTEVGGAGYQSATTTYTGKAVGSGTAPFRQYYAEASIGAGLGLATLHAQATSIETLGTAPGYSSPCCFYYNSNAIASSLQYYLFTGSAPETFTISYAVDATLLAYFDNQVDYRPNANVAAGVFLFDGVVQPGLELELPFGSMIGLDQTVLTGAMTNSQGMAYYTGSVTFTMNPGAGFWMSSFLAANAPQLPGYFIADASNTMTTSFTSGNTGLLTAQLDGIQPQQSVVPEPGTYALLVMGLLCVGVAGRKRMRLA